MVDAHDVVILSDYGKGGLTHVTKMIDAAKRHGKRILIDPKGDDYSKYRGATLLTPNRSEFREIMGKWRDDTDLAQRAEKLRDDLSLEALLVTRSEEGMSLFTASEILHEPTQAREVFDVSGAGDTVIATIALMLAAGSDIAAAVRIANRAAGVVVGKLGTATLTRTELEAAI
jgi:rfaE bifunctional protein kinase chain/domain